MALILARTAGRRGRLVSPNKKERRPKPSPGAAAPIELVAVPLLNLALEFLSEPNACVMVPVFLPESG